MRTQVPHDFAVTGVLKSSQGTPRPVRPSFLCDELRNVSMMLC